MKVTKFFQTYFINFSKFPTMTRPIIGFLTLGSSLLDQVSLYIYYEPIFNNSFIENASQINPKSVSFIRSIMTSHLRQMQSPLNPCFFSAPITTSISSPSLTTHKTAKLFPWDVINISPSNNPLWTQPKKEASLTGSISFWESEPNPAIAGTYTSHHVLWLVFQIRNPFPLLSSTLPVPTHRWDRDNYCSYLSPNISVSSQPVLSPSPPLTTLANKGQQPQPTF